MQTHRLYRVLAEQLEQAGFTVLRFDYRGTGDSSGGPEAMGVATWLEDVRAAAQELGRAAPGTRLVIVGLRFGATLASLASVRLPLRVRQLVLWDPVIDGLAYMREMAMSHRTFMRSELSQWQDNVGVDADGVPTESMGMPLTPALVAELRDLNLLKELPSADHSTIVSTQDAANIDAFRAALANRPGHRWLEIKDDENWNCDAALNSATVPAGIIRQIAANIQEVNP
jgi:pimeloyl-ACP methyl ester carboxylesterase